MSFAQIDLFIAARNNNTAIIHLFIKSGININSTDARDRKSLLSLVIIIIIEAANLLLTYKANINCQDNMGNTALMGACFKQHKEILKLLIENKVTIYARSFYGTTALIFTSTFRSVDIFQELLQTGTDKPIKDNKGHDARYYTSIQENKEVVALLQ